MEEPEPLRSGEGVYQSLQLQLPPDLYRAYQRCTWIIVNETGRDQLAIMEEMVRDFLGKYGC